MRRRFARKSFKRRGSVKRRRSYKAKRRPVRAQRIGYRW